nr:MAG TPA: hypothetical protein [Caudoviricetes sp.]
MLGVGELADARARQAHNVANICQRIVGLFERSYCFSGRYGGRFGGFFSCFRCCDGLFYLGGLLYLRDDSDVPGGVIDVFFHRVEVVDYLLAGFGKSAHLCPDVVTVPQFPATAPAAGGDGYRVHFVFLLLASIVLSALRVRPGEISRVWVMETLKGPFDHISWSPLPWREVKPACLRSVVSFRYGIGFVIHKC